MQRLSQPPLQIPSLHYSLSSHTHPHLHFHSKSLSSKTHKFRFSCSSSAPPGSINKEEKLEARKEYQPNFLDDVFLNTFKTKLVEEVGWDSEKPGYDGLIEVVNQLMFGRSNFQINEIAVRTLKSLFPPYLLELYRMLINPIGGGKPSAMLVARVTAVTCQWLMGPCSVNSISLPDGSSCKSGVFVERCKYLEESKCAGICVNTCKFPTQAFFKDEMGVPLYMEPNFSDYSCQFNFGVSPPSPENDSILKEPCLEICPNASRRRNNMSSMSSPEHCPKL